MTDLDRYKEHLESQGRLKPYTVTCYVREVSRVLKYLGGSDITGARVERLERYFARIKNKSTRRTTAMIVADYIKFTATNLPAVVGQAGGAIPPVRRMKKPEIKLRERWTMETLKLALENKDILIAQLARKVSDDYLFFQQTLQTASVDLDEIGRLADEHRELIERHLQIFMSLSAQGHNVHPKIDERVTR